MTERDDSDKSQAISRSTASELARVNEEFWNQDGAIIARKLMYGLHEDNHGMFIAGVNGAEIQVTEAVFYPSEDIGTQFAEIAADTQPGEFWAYPYGYGRTVLSLITTLHNGDRGSCIRIAGAVQIEGGKQLPLPRAYHIAEALGLSEGAQDRAAVLKAREIRRTGLQIINHVGVLRLVPLTAIGHEDLPVVPSSGKPDDANLALLKRIGEHS